MRPSLRRSRASTLPGRLASPFVSLVAAAAVPLAVTLSLSPAAQADGTDPGLRQQIEKDQEVALDEAVLDRGHVDMGPRYQDGRWSLMVHDDSRLEGSVWRQLDRTVFRVLDTALQQVPDDPAYSFLGVEPGTSVHVVPQTQSEDVVWVGWNTQDPEVMSTVDRGVTLSLTEVEGPGDVLVYLQDGGFGEPDVLWDSRVSEAQPLWVDVNTHTHANWVFTEPGVYLATIEASADLVDETSESTTGTVRFAVGDGASSDEALAAVPAVADGDPSAAEAGAEDPEATETDEERSWVVPAAIGFGIALLLVLIVTWLSLRGRSARRQAMEDA